MTARVKTKVVLGHVQARQADDLNILSGVEAGAHCARACEFGLFRLCFQAAG